MFFLHLYIKLIIPVVKLFLELAGKPRRGFSRARPRDSIRDCSIAADIMILLGHGQEHPFGDCEKKQEKMYEILQDIKVMVRDIEDPKEMGNYKKELKGFENEIEKFCEPSEIENRTTKKLKQ